jgi:murein DD-endopeptidase MepM/ murein hydrolase activator NlpD
MKLTITSRYGSVDAVHGTPHTGIDLLMNEGTPLRTFRDGVVTKILDLGDQNVGKGVVIQYDDGTYGIYGHLSEIQTQVGAKIRQGDQFALSGNTGHSTGAHLHFGLKDSAGNFTDPTLYTDEVAQYAGDVGFFERITTFNLWEWAYGKVSEITANTVADFMSDFAMAFPILAVVGGGVYALLNMFSKNAAKWGAIGTIIYGLLVAIT